jgi:hypothetical protein
LEVGVREGYGRELGGADGSLIVSLDRPKLVGL